jgi:hypothetical protein
VISPSHGKAESPVLFTEKTVLKKVKTQEKGSASAFITEETFDNDSNASTNIPRSLRASTADIRCHILN